MPSKFGFFLKGLCPYSSALNGDIELLLLLLFYLVSFFFPDDFFPLVYLPDFPEPELSLFF